MVYHQFYDEDGEKKKIGGVETYLSNLIYALGENYSVSLYQRSSKDFVKKEGNATIYGVRINDKNNVYRYLVKKAEERADLESDILIFGADICVTNTAFKRVVAIQHGIGWDISSTCACTKYDETKHFLRNIRAAYTRKRDYKKCSCIVCVDYNFVNWYRTFVKVEVDKLITIPNFTAIREEINRSHNDVCSIIFARRFYAFRGTRIFADALERVLQIYPNIKICIAGEGPDEEWLHCKLSKYEQIVFDSFSPADSISVHEKYDIAIIPSIGSEGTSLSLLEAMSAGCAVISSDVGGLTNIVINGFNGLIIRANEEELFCAIIKLIENKALRMQLSCNARATVESSFSFQIWKEKWLDIIQSL